MDVVIDERWYANDFLILQFTFSFKELYYTINFTKLRSPLRAMQELLLAETDSLQCLEYLMLELDLAIMFVYILYTRWLILKNKSLDISVNLKQVLFFHLLNNMA